MVDYKMIVQCVNCLKTRNWFTPRQNKCPFCGSKMMEVIEDYREKKLSKKQQEREARINKLVDNMTNLR